MIDVYIENELDDMYENWDEHAWDCLPDDVVCKIQLILNEAFKGDHATSYWTYEQPVEIDVDPNTKGDAE